ncbi:hypothetical protein [Nonomuraea turcica]|uniref:hypothetical protein n=1 Tax=Nonomuraea sp. G32 TaxID=3067274 RepID=UPI00273B57B5|nr:hypothetical protein [Nonomuraea sp. G32]MDP4503228.1 hypothetical protein [Nonomuraea sp. G32]
MASVHKEIRLPEQPTLGRGGHLVLLTGHTEAARRAILPIEVFTTFFGGRSIAVALT